MSNLIKSWNEHISKINKDKVLHKMHDFNYVLDNMEIGKFRMMKLVSEGNFDSGKDYFIVNGNKLESYNELEAEIFVGDNSKDIIDSIINKWNDYANKNNFHNCIIYKMEYFDDIIDEIGLSHLDVVHLFEDIFNSCSINDEYFIISDDNIRTYNSEDWDVFTDLSSMKMFW